MVTQMWELLKIKCCAHFYHNKGPWHSVATGLMLDYHITSRHAEEWATKTVFPVDNGFIAGFCLFSWQTFSLQLWPSLSLSSHSVSSYDKNQAYSTEWSDDEQPAAYSGNENGGNGNSFEDDSSTGKGVRVRALYDYEGQEQDELTFKAGSYQCPGP